jgi:nucleoside 2-deoxyribosyltransferase
MAKVQAGGRAKKKIFLSGPMDTNADIYGQRTILNALTPKFDAYLAPIDGVEIHALVHMLANPGAVSDQFLRAACLVQQIGWAQEMHQLLSCDALVLNMAGRVPDEGAVVEATTAYMAGKPVVIYKEGAMTFWDNFDNPMVAALDDSWLVIRDLSKLSGALSAALAKPAAGKGYQYVAPPNIAAAADFGAWVEANRKPLMLALSKAAQDLPVALQGLQPDMGSMQTFAEALIASTKSVAISTAKTKGVAKASRQAAVKAFG